MERPKIPKGFRGWRAFAKALLDYIEAKQPIDGPGVRFSEFPHGKQPQMEQSSPALFACYVNGESGSVRIPTSSSPQELP